MPDEHQRPQDEGIMMLDGGQYAGPLCPRTTFAGVDPMHALSVRHHDVAYKAAPKDADGEMTEPAASVVNALDADYATSDRMRLYRDVSLVFMSGYRQIAVESWYWQCHICGQILPAQRVPGQVPG